MKKNLEQDFPYIRARVIAAIKSIERGEYTLYEGREGLKALADKVKAKGRKLRVRQSA